MYEPPSIFFGTHFPEETEIRGCCRVGRERAIWQLCFFVAYSRHAGGSYRAQGFGWLRSGGVDWVGSRIVGGFFCISGEQKTNSNYA